MIAPRIARRAIIVLAAGAAMLAFACGGHSEESPTATAARPPRSPAPAASPPASAGSRDVLQQPFASDSIWNMPIGSGAVYVPAEIDAAAEAGLGIDPDVIILEPDAPLTAVHYNGDAWSGADRCEPEEYLYDVPIPDDFVIPGASEGYRPNHAAAVLMPDRRTLKQMQPLTRCEAGGPATALTDYPDADLYGDGIEGAHGGSGLSSIGGTIRLGELVPGGEIRHAIKINLYDPEIWGGDDDRFRWPAVKADEPSHYSGDNEALKMGALLALPADLDIDDLDLATEPARMLAWTLQNYGGYVVDQTSEEFYAVAVEFSPDGRVEDEFEDVWGFSMTPDDVEDPFSRDMAAIFQALAVVDNNAPDAVGGGGTPLQPLAPDVAP